MSLQVQGMDDARITLVGHVRQVPEDQHKAATAEFLKANPESFWVCSALPAAAATVITACSVCLCLLPCRWSLVTS